MTAYAIKAAVADVGAEVFHFERQKTMYGGKQVAIGDTVYVIHSQNAGGHGLLARGVVTAVQALPRSPALARQTPRVSLSLQRTGLALQRLGRAELKPCTQWDDGRPETELNFKFYRQATDKLVGLSDAAAVFLQGFF